VSKRNTEWLFTKAPSGLPDSGMASGGTLKYRTRDSKDFKSSGRWEFEGIAATDIRDAYVGNSVGMGGQ
jgi:hypothetical protein